MNSDIMFGNMYSQYYAHENNRWASFIINDELEEVQQGDGHVITRCISLKTPLLQIQLYSTYSPLTSYVTVSIYPHPCLSISLFVSLILKHIHASTLQHTNTLTYTYPLITVD